MRVGVRITGIILLLAGFVSAASAQQQSWGRGDRWRPGPGHDDRWGRPDSGSFQIGQVSIDRNHTYQVLNTNVDVSQIRLCANRDDLNLRQLDVALGNGRNVTLARQEYVRNRDCTAWKDIPGGQRRIVQVMIAGSSDRDNRETLVTVEGRTQQNWNPGRTWISWNNNQTSCGDGGGPFFKDSNNNQIPIMACPDQKPNGGPIGMSCEGLARGTLCYGWRFEAQPGFFCSAPNGKIPPTPAYIYSMYECP